ncbi:hypothetical protein SK128_000309 [Halocaridina rubra]|uniref:Cytochrome P450 n=1 Tax=Halocaridina rubra TaxID=373956 RepID=A0AAN9FUE3_HALRR
MFSALLVFVIIIISLVYITWKKNALLPPGIWGWPIVGSLPSQEVSMVDQVKELRKWFGDIFMWRIGGRTYIFLCNYQLIKTALNKPELANRPHLYSMDVFTNYVESGIVNVSGKLWQNSRRFALRHLKSLGMGKSTYESVIQQEVVSLIKNFQNLIGEPTLLPWSINVAVLNVIWRIVADRRYEIDDEEILHFQELLGKTLENVSPIIALCDLLPWLPKIVPDAVIRWLGADEYLAIAQQSLDFMMDVIKEHQLVLDTENPRDYIDYYLIEMERQKEDPQSTMSIIDLASGLQDLFIAGSETTSSTIRWAIFYIAKHQDVQKKVHEEIDSVVDRNTLPSLEHRDRLPYLDAVTREVQRLVSLVALSLPHCAAEETMLEGFRIPKDAVIMTSLECCHTDPNLWKNPDEFYPEHFLDQDGRLLAKKEGYLPFSIGKRVCPGESLAYMELYLFLGGILQNFHFALPEGEDLNPKRNPKDRFINAPKPYKVIISKRECTS